MNVLDSFRLNGRGGDGRRGLYGRQVEAPAEAAKTHCQPHGTKGETAVAAAV